MQILAELKILLYICINLFDTVCRTWEKPSGFVRDTQKTLAPKSQRFSLPQNVI